MSEDLFSLPIPLSVEDQEFLSQIYGKKYRFPSVYEFVKAAQILNFWPDKKILSRFEAIFLRQEFSSWDDEEEVLQLPHTIFFHLYQLVSLTLCKDRQKFATSPERPWETKIASFDGNFVEQLVNHEKMAFLLCFCKNLNFKRLFINIEMEDRRPELDFYIEKILKRNPNVHLDLGVLSDSNLFKQVNKEDSFREKLKNYQVRFSKSKSSPTDGFISKIRTCFCLEKEVQDISNSKFDLESKNAFDCEIASLDLVDHFLNSLKPCVFQWRKAKSLSISFYSIYIQEFDFFLQFFSSIPNLEISFEYFDSNSSLFSPAKFSFQNLESLILRFKRNSELISQRLKSNVFFSEKLKCLKIEGLSLKPPIDWLISTCPRLESLTISVLGRTEKEALELLKALSTLKCLKNFQINLDSSIEFNNLFLKNISIFLQDLKTLKIVFESVLEKIKNVERCYFSNLEKFCYHCPKKEKSVDFFHLFVQKLKCLKSYEHFSMHPLPNDLFSKLPHLESFSLGKDINNESIDQSFLFSPEQRLKSLEIRILTSFDQFSHLRSLKINSSTPNLFQRITKLKRLEELTIYHTQRNNQIFDFYSISQLNHLKRLHLEGNLKKNIWATKGIPSKGESLEVVTWKSSTNIFRQIVRCFCPLDIEVIRVF